MPEEAVIEAVETALPTEVVEETPETTEVAETPEAAAPEAKTDDRAFAGKMRELHKQLSASQDPADQRAAKQLKQLFFADKALREEFPGGLSEVRKLKETVAQLGAPEEITAAKEAAATLEEIDSKWMAGDPGFIDELVSLNADSFKKLMPVALTKYAQADPEGYQRTLSGIISQTLLNSRVDTQLMLISDAVESGNKEKALALLKGIEDWMGKLDETAKSVPTQPASKETDELAQQRAAADERENQIFAKELAFEVNPWRDALIKGEFAKLRQGKPIESEGRYAVAKRAVEEEIARRIKATNPKFREQFVDLYGQKDMEGLVKISKAENQKHLAKAVAHVHQLLFPTASKKPAPTPLNGQQVKPAEQGWTKVPQRPRPDEINRDRGATSDDMILAGKAILRNGKRVMWDRV